MIRRMRTALICIVAMLSAPASALSGQRPGSPKAVIEVDGVYHATSQTIVDTISPRINVETGSMTSTSDVDAGPAFRGAVGVRLWRQLGAGVSVAMYSSPIANAVTASIPHPFVFGSARQIQGAADGMQRDERSVALELRAFLPLSSRLLLSFAGGPAWTSVEHDTVTDIRYAESYPYDAATFTSATVSRESQSKVGIAASAGFAYFFSRQFGVGASARFSGGKVALSSLGNGTIESKIGGFDIGGGLRVRF
jgi:hypothetical protein